MYKHFNNCNEISNECNINNFNGTVACACIFTSD